MHSLRGCAPRSLSPQCPRHLTQYSRKNPPTAASSKRSPSARASAMNRSSRRRSQSLQSLVNRSSYVTSLTWWISASTPQCHDQSAGRGLRTDAGRKHSWHRSDGLQTRGFRRAMRSDNGMLKGPPKYSSAFRNLDIKADRVPRKAYHRSWRPSRASEFRATSSLDTRSGPGYRTSLRRSSDRVQSWKFR